LEITRPQRLRRRFGVTAICLAVLAGGDDTVRSQSSELKDLARTSLAQIDGELRLPGLQKDVQVIRDTWGVPLEADGATYRQIIDAGDWDRSLTVKTAGASGQPESPYYGNWLPYWAENRYFPMVYGRQAVDEKAAHRLKRTPGPRQSAQ